MKPFSSTRSRRETTLVVILVWLFALASGMANACLLEPPGQHSRAAASHPADDHSSHVHADDSLSNDASTTDHDDGADPSRESCLKACDEGSKAQTKLQTGVDVTDPGLAPFIAFAWNAVIPVASAPGRFDDLQVPVVGPPFRLRTPRLTL